MLRDRRCGAGGGAAIGSLVWGERRGWWDGWRVAGMFGRELLDGEQDVGDEERVEGEVESRGERVRVRCKRVVRGEGRGSDEG